jgi:hypothetical protein
MPLPIHMQRRLIAVLCFIAPPVSIASVEDFPQTGPYGRSAALSEYPYNSFVFELTKVFGGKQTFPAIEHWNDGGAKSRPRGIGYELVQPASPIESFEVWNQCRSYLDPTQFRV